MLEQYQNEAPAKGWFAYIHQSGETRWLWACEVPFDQVDFSKHIVMTGSDRDWAISTPRASRHFHQPGHSRISITLWGADLPTLDNARKLLDIAFPA